MKRIFSALIVLALASCEAPQIYSDPIAGPRTRDADAFAKAFLDQMQARSFAADREFCGIFGRDTDGYVIATPPILGRVDSCRTPDPAEGFNVFASYHSHGAHDEDVDTEVPSSYDLRADREEGVVGYISTPGGRIWFSQDGAATLLCGRGCITMDPEFTPGLYGPIANRYTIATLEQREAGF
ncbi:DUF4329 domain-containing protein [Roseovarius sp. 2305UL8-3]|uniref:DUF4329 domain-containing protein n=1 Tax=Roseovarius conchicola TaxID=3121636 RepID=UPI00352944F7